METKEVIRNYWDYRSETYSTEIVEQSEEEWATWKNMLSSTVDRREHLEILDVGTGPGQLAWCLQRWTIMWLLLTCQPGCLTKPEKKRLEEISWHKFHPWGCRGSAVSRHAIWCGIQQVSPVDTPRSTKSSVWMETSVKKKTVWSLPSMVTGLIRVYSWSRSVPYQMGYVL